MNRKTKVNVTRLIAAVKSELIDEIRIDGYFVYPDLHNSSVRRIKLFLPGGIEKDYKLCDVVIYEK